MEWSKIVGAGPEDLECLGNWDVSARGVDDKVGNKCGERSLLSLW